MATLRTITWNHRLFQQVTCKSSIHSYNGQVFVTSSRILETFRLIEKKSERRILFRLASRPGMQQDAQEAGTDGIWEKLDATKMELHLLFLLSSHITCSSQPLFRGRSCPETFKNALGQVCLVSTTKGLSLLVVICCIFELYCKGLAFLPSKDIGTRVDEELLVSGIEGNL